MTVDVDKPVIQNAAPDTEKAIVEGLDPDYLDFTLHQENALRAPGVIGRHSQFTDATLASNERRFRKIVKSIAAQVGGDGFDDFRPRFRKPDWPVNVNSAAFSTLVPSGGQAVRGWGRLNHVGRHKISTIAWHFLCHP
jgi:hypothetical protein